MTPLLQRGFLDCCPDGWDCRAEVNLLPAELNTVLGYASRADAVLEKRDGTCRLWVEFEVSRADPVANHAKFAAAHLLQPQPAMDIFVSMVSSHVDRGRRNLAAQTIRLMRAIGMDAFQTVLLPGMRPEEIKALNHAPADAATLDAAAIRGEIDRLMTVTQVCAEGADAKIYFAGDYLEVLLNLRQWNRDLDRPVDRDRWGKRLVTYFVADPVTADFAPSKFCAYIPIARLPATPPAVQGMTVAAYSDIEQDTVIFDGTRARTHLVKNLAMRAIAPGQDPGLDRAFARWLERRRDAITLHPRGPVYLLPPDWFS